MFPAVQQFPGALHNRTSHLGAYPAQGPIDQYGHHPQEEQTGRSMAMRGIALPHRKLPANTADTAAARSDMVHSKTTLHSGDSNEYQLRRKTPGGTINGGYDGNPVELASQPPPQKQMVIPGSVQPALPSAPRFHTDYQQVHQASFYAPEQPYHGPTQSLSSFVPYGLNRLGMGPNSLAEGCRVAPDGSRQLAPAMDCAPNAPLAVYQPLNQGFRTPTALQPLYQHQPGPALFNPGAIVPQAWHAGSFGSHQPVQPTFSPYGYQQYCGPTRYSADYKSPPIGTPDLSTPFAYRCDENGMPFNSTSQQLESLSLGSHHDRTPAIQPRQTASGFRDKALANAHTTYLELLAYLHSRKKANQVTQPGAQKNQSKMVIFPRLPKPLSQNGSNIVQRHSHDGMVGFPAVAYNTTRGPRDANFHAHSTAVDRNVVRMDNTTNPPFYHLFNTAGSLFPRPFGAVSPLAGAQAAIEMLHNLCEQSGWKWADGILLGGCLYYGLEQFENALDWFEKILLLDEE